MTGLWYLGDIVILKCGGRKMVVNTVQGSDGYVRCCWLKDDGTFEVAAIHADALKGA